MRIAVIGAGGVGGYFGARLLAAGGEVFFIARGEHLQALKVSGLTVHCADQPLNFPQIEVYSEEALEQIPQADLALSCVKLYDAPHAAQLCQAVLKPEGIAFSLQNGIDGPGILAEVLGAERSFAGSVIISAFVEAPGVIRHLDTQHVIRLEQRSVWSEQLCELCLKAGLQAAQFADGQQMLWQKFARLVPLSAISALTRQSLGYVNCNEFLKSILQQLVLEVLTVGRAKGIELSDAILAEVFERIAKAPYEFKPSLLLDLERGKPLETPYLSGAVVRLGRELGIETPYNATVVAALQPFLSGFTD